MSITIELSPEDERKLEERAKLRGQALQEYVAGLIRRDIESPDFATLLEPFQCGFEASGRSEAELTELMDRELEAVRAEKLARKRG